MRRRDTPTNQQAAPAAPGQATNPVRPPSLLGDLLALQAAVGNRALVDRLRREPLAFGGAAAGRRVAAHTEFAPACGPSADLLVQCAPNDPELTSPFWADNARLQAAVRNAPPLTASDNGEPVAILQEALAEQGIPLPRSLLADGSFDGRWGPETTGAVRAFQQQVGITPVGGWEAGRKTLGALDGRLPSRRRGRGGERPSPVQGAALAAAKDIVDPVMTATDAPDRRPLLLAFGVPGNVGAPPTGPTAPNTHPIKVKWAGGLNKSLRNLIRFKVTEAAADKIVLDLLADPSAYYTAADGKHVARSEFEATAEKDGAFVLMQGMVALLMAKSGLTQAAIEEGGKDEEKFGALSDQASRWQFFGADEGKSSSPAQEARERGRDRDKGQKVEGDVSVLAVPSVASLYVRLIQEYGGVAVPQDLHDKAAQSGLTPADVARLVGARPSAAAITGLFTQAVGDGRTALAADPDTLGRSPEFASTATTLVEQFTWGNPTVARNEVRLRASGVPEQAPGLVFTDGTLYYDVHGNPLRSFAGEGFRDPGFQGAPRQHAWYNLINLDAIADPEVREFFRLLKQQVGDSTALVVRGAEALYEHFGPVRDLVLDGLDEEVKKQLVDALKVIAFFLVAKAAITAAERSNVPALQLIGATADGLLAAGQLLLDIDFAGSTVAMLVGAGYHLCRVRKDEKGEYSPTSKFEMRAGADIIRQILSMVVAQALIKEGLGHTEAGYQKVREKLSATAAGEASRLRCNTCILEVAPSRRAEQDFREMYRDLVKKRKVQDGKPYVSPDYPGVVIHPNGNAFGPYDQLLRAAQHGDLTGKQPKEGQGYVVQIHHILEDTIAAKFGVSRDRGRCVAIESDDHLRFSRYMTENATNRKLTDIWDAYAAHREMYQALGNKELLPELDHSIAEQKSVILASYEAGKVPGRPRRSDAGWADRLATARAFLDRF